MKKGYFVAPPRGTRFAEDVALIRGGFADYLRDLGFSAFTIEHYLRRLVRVAHWLYEHPRRLPLSRLTRRAVSNLDEHDVFQHNIPESVRRQVYDYPLQIVDLLGH